MTNIFKKIFTKPNPEKQILIKSILNELVTERVALLVEHSDVPQQFYAIVSEVNEKDNKVTLIDLTPGSEAMCWRKKDKLRISSTPKKGKHYIFDVDLVEIRDTDSYYYHVSFPAHIQSHDFRQYPRIKILGCRNVNTQFIVMSPVEISTTTAQLLGESCIYEGNMLDVSLSGMQVIFPEDCRDIFMKGQKITANITAAAGVNFECVFEIRWVFFDSIDNMTRLGGRFVNVTEELTRMLGYFISNIQAGYYHRYV